MCDIIFYNWQYWEVGGSKRSSYNWRKQDIIMLLLGYNVANDHVLTAAALQLQLITERPVVISL